MSSIEFINYEEVSGEKYIGIATIRAHLRDFGTMIIRFKVQHTKDGQNLFITAPSYKKVVDGQDVWTEWFMFDSRSQESDLQSLIKAKVKAYYASRQATPAPQQQAPWGNMPPMPPIEPEQQLPF